MKMKKTKEKPEVFNDESTQASREERAYRQLQNMKRREVQAACISRGLDFELAVSYSNLQLSSFFTKNLDNPQNPQLLNEFDEWLDKKLEERGYKKGESVRSPIFKLGVSGNPDN